MTQIADKIHWVGAIDWELRNFHGYATPSGSTYNAYLIEDERPALIDTVKERCFEEMAGRIRRIMDPAKIRFIVSNHTEMDHSGAIDRLLRLCPNAEVVCSPKGEEGLKRHYKKEWKFKVVDSGDTLDLGRRKLEFLLTPMVHWPDSMAAYSRSGGVLFSNDAFGQHYASPERFVEEAGPGLAVREAAKYYANIVLPYGSQVLKYLEAARGLEVKSICPSHGLVWRRGEDIAEILRLYRRWANHETAGRAVIVYDTMWGSTRKMAQRLYEEMGRLGIAAKIMNLRASHISDVITEVLFSRALLVGSPILNGRMLPTMAALLMYLKGLKPKNRFYQTFGSYGWATAGFKELESCLKEAGLEPAGEGCYLRYVPGEEDLRLLEKTARAVRERISG